MPKLYIISFDTEKTRMVWLYLTLKKGLGYVVFSRYDRIPACDGQTDILR